MSERIVRMPLGGALSALLIALGIPTAAFADGALPVNLPEKTVRISADPSVNVYNDEVQTGTAIRGAAAIDYGWFRRLQVGFFADAELTGARSFADHNVGSVEANLLFAPLDEIGIRLDLGATLRKDLYQTIDGPSPHFAGGVGLPVSVRLLPWLALDVGRPYAPSPRFDIFWWEVGSYQYAAVQLPIGIRFDPVDPLAVILRGGYRREALIENHYNDGLKASYVPFGADVLVKLGRLGNIVAGGRFDSEVHRPLSRFDAEIVWQLLL
jgi:hypothetical protein